MMFSQSIVVLGTSGRMISALVILLITWHRHPGDLWPYLMIADLIWMTGMIALWGMGVVFKRQEEHADALADTRKSRRAALSVNPTNMGSRKMAEEL